MYVCMCIYIYIYIYVHLLPVDDAVERAVVDDEHGVPGLALPAEVLARPVEPVLEVSFIAGLCVC